MKKVKRKKPSIERVFSRRIFILTIFLSVLFLILSFQLYDVMYIKRNTYQEKLKHLQKSIIYQDEAPRGRIYDRNYNLLVDNQEIPMITYQKGKKVTTKEEINLAYTIAYHIQLDLSKLYERNLKEFYLLLYPKVGNSKITKEEYAKVDERKLTLSDIENLKISRITKEELEGLSEIDKKAALVYYLMNKGYSYEMKKVKTSEVSPKEIAYIVENMDNLPGFKITSSYERIYYYQDTLKSLLGNISSIEQGLPLELKDYYLEKGYSLNDRVGLSYLEKQYEEQLKGQKAIYELSNNELTLVKEGIRGNDLVLTIDINLQREVEKILEEEVLLTKSQANTKFYNRSFAVVQDPKTGDILAMSGKQALEQGNSYTIVDCTTMILTSPMTVGSVVKGASLLTGYDQGVVKIGEYILDECIKIQSTPKKCSWRTLGNINDIEALALSSNVYQFKVAMRVAKANYQYDRPLAIDDSAFDIYRKMYHEFGLGVKTGIDLPVESTGYTSDSREAGHLLDYVMGQFETYTPLQLSQYITTMVNNGERLTPHLLLRIHQSTEGHELGEVIKEYGREVLNQIDTKQEYFDRIKQGFYAVTHASYGIGHGYFSYQNNGVGKTGTSESFLDTNGDGVIDQETISTAFVGYAPFDNPEMTIVVTSPDVSYPSSRVDYTSMVTRRITKRITDYYFSR